MEQTNKQTKENKIPAALAKYETPGELVETVEAVLARFDTGAELQPEEKAIVSAVMSEFVRLRKAIVGRKRKWNSMQEKYAYYNARRKKKT